MRKLSWSALFAVLVSVGPMAHANPPAAPVGALPTTAAAMPEKVSPAQVASPRVSVAAVMIETGQALLWDHLQEQYVLVRPGDGFQGFIVTAVAPDQVVLSRDNQHFLLPRTSDTLDLDSRRPRAGSTAATGQSVALVDPYAAELHAPAASAVSAEPAVELVDPYAAQGSHHARAFDAAAAPVDRVGDLGIPAMVLEPRAPATTRTRPRGTAMPAPVVQAQADARAVREERYTVQRREIDEAMADFQSLGKQVQVELTQAGVHVTAVASSSLPHRMGLRAGDVILTVDGRSIASLDDAAAIYAQLLDARGTTVTVRRGERLIHMRYRFA